MSQETRQINWKGKGFKPEELEQAPLLPKTVQLIRNKALYYSLSVFAYVNIKAFQMPQEVITLMLKILIFNTPTYIFWSKPATL